MSVIGNPLLLLDNVIWLIKDGKLSTRYTATRYGGSYLSEDSNGYVVLHSNAASNTYATCAFAAIDLTKYNKLVFDGQARGYYRAGCPAVGVLSNIASGSSYSTFSNYYQLLSATTNNLSTRATVSINISALTGNKQIGFQEAGSGSSNAQGDIYCYNLYLTTAS